MLLWLLVLRIRRADHAVYVISGLGPTALTTLAVAEMLIVIATAATISAAVTAITLHTHHIDPAAAATGLASATRALVAATLLGATWCWHTGRRTPVIVLDIIKDR